LSEVEFWSMTLAQVTAIYRIRVLEWDRTRDFFQAQAISLQLTGHVSPEDILKQQYPSKKHVIITHDPDHGAAGDWRAMRAALKDRTERVNARKSKSRRPSRGIDR
jgi:hypothetical protein